MENHPLKTLAALLAAVAAHALSAQSLPPRPAITAENAASLKLRVLAQIRGNAYDVAATYRREVIVNGVGLDAGRIHFDLETGRRVDSCDFGPGIYALAETPGVPIGQMMAYGRDSGIRIIPEIGLCYPQYAGPIAAPWKLPASAKVTCLRFPRESKCFLGSGHSDGTVRLWDTCKRQLLWTSPPNSSSVSKVAVTSDGKTIAAAYEDASLRLWPVGGNRARLAPLAKAKSDMRFRVLTFIANGHKVVVALGNETVVWDLATDRVNRLPRGADAVSPDDKIAVTIGEYVGEGTQGYTPLVLWNLANGAEIATLKTASGMLASSATFTPDGTALLASTNAGEVLVWQP